MEFLIQTEVCHVAGVGGAFIDLVAHFLLSSFLFPLSSFLLRGIYRAAFLHDEPEIASLYLAPEIYGAPTYR